MPSIRNVLVAYGLSTLSVVSGYIGDKDQCEKHGLNTAYQRGTGKIGGEPFCTSKIRDGKLINSLECWSDRDSLRGLKFYYTDRSEMMLGMKDNLNGRVVHGRATWNPAVDTFEHLKLWDNGYNGMIGRIDMKLSNGQQIDCGREASWGAPSVDADRGAGGMMIGAEGGVGDGIDYIKFQFTSSGPSRVTLKQLDIPAVKNGEGLELISLKKLRIINRFENDTLVTKDFTWKEQTEKKRQWNFEETNKFGMDQKFSISVDVPEVGSIGSESSMSWETASTTSQENINRTDSTEEWGIQPLTIQPGKAKVITIMAIKGEVQNAAYNAKMEVAFKDHSTFTYDTRASFEMVRYASMDAVFDDEDASEAIKQIGQNGSIEVDKDGNEKKKNKRTIEFQA